MMNKEDMEVYNYNVIRDMINNGTHTKEYFEFNCLDKKGGNLNVVVRSNGEVILTDSADKVTFRKHSKEDRGYVTVNLYIPYNEEAHIESNKVKQVNNKKIVEYTCYIHRLVANYIEILNGGKTINSGTNVNHMNGVTFVNSFDNIELGNLRQNGLHGTVLTSTKIQMSERCQLYTNDYGKEQLGLKYSLSYKLVEEYMNIDDLFKIEVLESYKTLRSSKLENSYISNRKLIDFWKFVEEREANNYGK